jgi:hypothetical protein
MGSMDKPDGKSFDRKESKVVEDLDADAVTTDALNQVRYVRSSAGISDINSAIDANDNVILVGDHTSLSDRIEAAANTTLIIAATADVRLADGASPTQISVGGTRTPLIYNDGKDHFNVINQGTLDANDSNFTSGIPIFYDGRSSTINGGFINSATGQLEDGNDCVFLESTDGVNIGILESDSYQESVLVLQRAHNTTWDTVIGKNGKETVDVNADSRDCHGETVVGVGLSQEAALDVDAAPNLHVDTLTVDNCRAAFIGNAGSGVTSQNITIDSIQGTADTTAVILDGDIPDCSIDLNLEVTAGGNAEVVELRHSTPNGLDGLELTGKARGTDANSGKAVHFDADDEGNVMSDIHLDIETVSKGNDGIELASVKNVSGRIAAHNCSGAGVAAVVNVSNIDATIIATNNGGRGLRIDGSGHKIRGRAESNSSEDLNFFACEDSLLNIRFGTINGLTDGTRVAVNGKAYQNDTPGSGDTNDEWNGNARFASDHNITVEDISVDPSDLYKAEGSGNWIQIG